MLFSGECSDLLYSRLLMVGKVVFYVYRKFCPSFLILNVKILRISYKQQTFALSDFGLDF